MVYLYSLVGIALGDGIEHSLRGLSFMNSIAVQEEEDEEEQDGLAPPIPSRPLRRRAAQLA